MNKSTLSLLFAVTTGLLACGEGEDKPVDTGATETDIDTDTDTDTDTGDTQDTDITDTGHTDDTSDTHDTDTNDTNDTNDTEDTDDTEDTQDTAIADTADTGVIDTGTNPVGPGPNAVVDFSLPDTNPSSPTVGQTISPRDYLQEVSGWYFIKAT